MNYGAEWPTRMELALTVDRATAPFRDVYIDGDATHTVADLIDALCGAMRTSPHAARRGRAATSQLPDRRSGEG
jgi:hypothetical protein